MKIVYSIFLVVFCSVNAFSNVVEHKMDTIQSTNIYENELITPIVPFSDFVARQLYLSGPSINEVMAEVYTSFTQTLSTGKHLSPVKFDNIYPVDLNRFSLWSLHLKQSTIMKGQMGFEEIYGFGLRYGSFLVGSSFTMLSSDIYLEMPAMNMFPKYAMLYSRPIGFFTGFHKIVNKDITLSLLGFSEFILFGKAQWVYLEGVPFKRSAEYYWKMYPSLRAVAEVKKQINKDWLFSFSVSYRYVFGVDTLEKGGISPYDINGLGVVMMFSVLLG